MSLPTLKQYRALSMFRARSSRKGFTLVELLVVTPVALLVIVGFIALMVVMVGDVIASRTFNTMTYDIQNALDTIERDVRLSTEFQTTSGELPAPQGKNGNTSPFTSTAGDLVLGTIATDKNPLDPTRRFVHYNAPFECSSEHRYKNRVFFTSVIYFVRDNSLWRRSYVPSYTPSNMCSTPWQINTCSPDYTSAQTQCQSTDSEILKDVKSFRVAYHERPEDTVELSSASASNASTIKVSIELEGRAAGRTVGAASSTRATKLSSRDVNLAPPDAPVVSGSRSGTDAVFSWPGVPTASSYIIRYNINGGGWRTASENSTETTLSVPANHGDTVSVEVMARNTTGTSPKASASSEIPIWSQCGLINGWRDYSSSYAGCGFTKTKDGVVVLQGLIRSGTSGGTVHLFRLPEAYRPSTNLIFTTTITGNNSARLQVTPSGYVSIVEPAEGGSSGYLSLSGIYFIPASTSYDWTNFSLLNGWQNYNTAYSSTAWANGSSARDSSGRVHVQGLLTQGTFTTGTPIAQLPADSRPESYLHFPVRSAPSTPGQPNLVGVTTSGNIVARGTSYSTYLSSQFMFYPSSHTGWSNFTQVSGAPSSGQIGNSWTAYASGYPTPAYTKSSDGIVTIKGLIKGGTNGSIIAVLPPGYRPSNRIITTTTANGFPSARIDVTSAGQVIATGNTSPSWTAINLSFRASP